MEALKEVKLVLGSLSSSVTALAKMNDRGTNDDCPISAWYWPSCLFLKIPHIFIHYPGIQPAFTESIPVIQNHAGC